MRSLIRAKRTKADPAPSRWAWRMQRLMLTPGFRLALRAGVPFCVTLMEYHGKRKRSQRQKTAWSPRSSVARPAMRAS